MPIEHDIRKSLAAIRERARQLAGSKETQTTPAETEILAALREGTLRFDTVDDGAFERCIRTFGIDSVVDALLSGSEAGEKASEATVISFEERSQQLKAASAGQVTGARKIMGLPSNWLAVAAAIVLAVSVVYLTLYAPGPSSEPTGGNPTFALQWPPSGSVDLSSTKTWGSSGSPLAKNMPDYAKGSATLGAGDERYTAWRLATVIVRSPDGWGSGAFISPDGWLLTNYHVVANSAQTAAITGSPVVLDIITARMTDGRLKPQPALKATVYRVDPVHDLALLKLQSLPPGLSQVAYFKFADDVKDGESCFVIGSQDNGPAWWVRSGNVSQEFHFPDDLSQFAAGAASPFANIDRDHAMVVVTDTRIAPGDSGGPLLNSDGQLIGLTFATSANESAGSVGWHIALKHLKAFTATFPTQPEGVPFDPWTAGLPEASLLEPQLRDVNRDGRPDTLIYRYAVPSHEQEGGEQQAVAMTAFVDFSQSAKAGDDSELVPRGIWGMEDRGKFRFDVFMTVRADGTTAVGYTNRDGIIDEIRVAAPHSEQAGVVWRRSASGQWQAQAASTSLIDASRVGNANLGMLQTIATQIWGQGQASGENPRPQPSQQPQQPQGQNRQPNKM